MGKDKRVEYFHVTIFFCKIKWNKLRNHYGKKGDEMQVSYQTVLKKMEEKVVEAKKETSEVKIREHIQAIKTLCEVLLEEQMEIKQTSFQSKMVEQKPISMANRFETEKEEGDSIFDF
ncbi:YwdI family protein [Fervidibacillus halotolerans]|uniref:YwdI family protein n=1 Tax=Fervidibacillus halotolerans TaxID=2980027 RepID=A0A9E8LYU2_9BACI|nr:YwdI family protein [Fervidibacillus halotolerans]WAA12222.1 YwdI family protein [Fervidibacillus halotolerans]